MKELSFLQFSSTNYKATLSQFCSKNGQKIGPDLMEITRCEMISLRTLWKKYDAFTKYLYVTCIVLHNLFDFDDGSSVVEQKFQLQDSSDIHPTGHSKMNAFKQILEHYLRDLIPWRRLSNEMLPAKRFVSNMTLKMKRDECFRSLRGIRGNLVETVVFEHDA